MKGILLSLLLACSFALGSHIDVPGASGGGGGSGDVTGPGSALDGGVCLFDGTTGKVIKGTTVLKVTNQADRTKFNGDTMEWHPFVDDGQYLYLSDRQLTLVQKNLYFEGISNGIGWGDIWWDVHDGASVGYSKRECTESARCIGGPKDYLAGTAYRLDKNGDGTTDWQVETNGVRAATYKADRNDFYSWDNNWYWEQVLNFGGLHLAQTNLNFGMNNSTFIVGNSNANPNGLRLFTTTLSSGTVTVSNASVTVNTVPFMTMSSASNPGFLTYTASAGSLTINSSNGSDGSTLKVFLVENGR